MTVAVADLCGGSADMAHATHPNYPGRHKSGHLIEVNAGPALKVHSNLRYANDGRTAAAFELACWWARVALLGYEHRPARTGIPTVGLGAAQLALHFAREGDGCARRGTRGRLRCKRF